MKIASFLKWVLDKLPINFRNKIRHIPVLKQAQAALQKRYLNGQEFEAIISGGPAKGLRFPVTLPQDKLMWVGTWEIEFAIALANEIKKGWLCYDIGSYKGYYAGIMALHGASKVVLFEPMPDNIKKITRLMELNGSLPLQLERMAVSDTQGEAVFKLMKEETMGKLESSKFEPGSEAQNQLTVETISLDHYCKTGSKDPDFIKIDVEGAEEFVLKGALQLLARKQPLLMIEIHSRSIGESCYGLLKNIYKDVRVLETGKIPSASDPEICHYIARSR